MRKARFVVYGLWFMVAASAGLRSNAPKTKDHEPSTPQREHPISEVIRAPASGLSARPGEKFDVTLAVTVPGVDKIWHLYSITQAPGGPIRTKIGVEPAAAFRIAGTIKG